MNFFLVRLNYSDNVIYYTLDGDPKERLYILTNRRPELSNEFYDVRGLKSGELWRDNFEIMFETSSLEEFVEELKERNFRSAAMRLLETIV